MEVHLTSQEARDLVFLLLDAVDIAEGTISVPAFWTAEAWEQCLLLLDRLYGQEDSN